MKGLKAFSVIVKAAQSINMRAFDFGVRLFAFVTLYFTLMSPLTVTVARGFAALPAIVIALLFLISDGKKKVMWAVVASAVLYTVLCLSITFTSFADGAALFLNSVSSAVNASRHSGWALISVAYNGPADFVFSSVIAIWLGIGSVAIADRSGFAFTVCSLALLIIWLCIGLLPRLYAMVLLALMWIVLLAADKSFSLKATGCYLAVTAVVFAAILPCAIYSGSAGTKKFRNGIASTVDNMIYGTDTLPQGKLTDSSGLHAGDKQRLLVTLSSRSPKLYLKGFVGSDIDEFGVWQPTDKNAYIEKGYQGVLDYVNRDGLPFMQYARYSELCGVADKIPVTVENVGANRKYMYVPYGLNDYSSGKRYYDLNMQRGAFTSQNYSYSVFSGDYSGEWTIQERWLFNDFLRTSEMDAYIELENEYRAFVYDTYCTVDEDIADTIRDRLFGISTDSVNTAARLLRTYFEENFFLTDNVDKFGGDFLADFYGGKIQNANAVYFATAATYAFRALGFAARYAEGYLVETESKSGAQTVTVTDQNAHAWTEVYFDGIGWLPIEVTFEVSDPNVPVDPGPEVPVDPEPVDPNLPDNPDDPKEPEIPAIPNPGGDELLTKQEVRLLIVLKVFLPILCVLLAAGCIVLAVLAYRNAVIHKKRRELNCNGESYGRSIYSIVENDCKSFGGFSESMLEEKGVPSDYTRRFIQLVERCVYGGYDLSENEKNFTTFYVQCVAKALEGEGRLDKFINRYIKCLGI